MNIFLFRLSNLISTISIGFIIILNSIMFLKKYDRYERRVDNLILNINGEVEFISNKEILQHLVYSILVLLILMTFHWLIFGKLSLWIKKDKYIDDIVNIKKFIFRISRVFSIFCIVMFLFYFISKTVDYFQFGRIRFLREIILLHISSLIFFFNIVFFRECSLWINKEVKVQKIFNLTNIKYTLSKIILVICVCLFLQYCMEVLYSYYRWNGPNFEKGLIYLFLSPTFLIYNYLCFGKLRFLVQKPIENN